MSKIRAEVADDVRVSHSVLEAVAEAEDADPVDLTPPLYEVVDPDALETLFTTPRTLGKVIFNYSGCEVCVFADGYISVEKNGV